MSVIGRIMPILVILYILPYIIQILNQVLEQFRGVIVSDNFDDGTLNTDIWEIISDDPAGSTSEVNGVLRVTTSGSYHQGAVTKNSYDLTNTVLTIKFVKNENVRQTLQLGAEKRTDGAEPAECYYISHDRFDDVFEIRRKLYGEAGVQVASKPLPSLPITVKVRVEGNTIRFYLNDNLIHSEEWALSTKTCYIWLFVAGTTAEAYHGDSEYDDFILQRI